MDFFFHPKGIALIGASGNPKKGGYAIFKNLATGFTGGIYPVNPRYPEIDGVPCYEAISDLPDHVDLAIIFIPAKHAVTAVRECAERGIPGVIIESGGFAETGAEGKAHEEDIRNIAKETGIRVWGPNCMGMVDCVNSLVFSFVSPTIWEYGLVPGGVSLIVQSGMLSGAFLIDCMTHGAYPGTGGFSKVCSVGNKIDVNENDLLPYLLDDPDTHCVGLYLEGFSDGRRFMEIARSTDKPIVLLKGGKSAIGAKAALSHTASLAGNHGIVKSAMLSSGVVEASDFKEMMDICRGLARFPRLPEPRKGRIAVLTYSGGAGIVTADFLEKEGLSIASLSDNTIERLKTVFPEWMPVANPVDLWPAVERSGGEKTFLTAIAAVLADPEVDGVILHMFTGGMFFNFDIAPIARSAKGSTKPIFCWLLGEAEAAKKLHIRAGEMGIPVFREIERAVRVMAMVFHRNRMVHTIRTYPIPATVFPKLSKSALEILEKKTGTGMGTLDEFDSGIILKEAGIPVVEEYIANDLKEAGEIAEKLGFPVVVKGLDKDRIHKTDAGLVLLDNTDMKSLEESWYRISEALEGRGRILIQKQVKKDLEMIAGFMRDPQFGPGVMIGFGGVFAEVIRDTAFGVAPFSMKEAMDIIHRIRHVRIFTGYRGIPGIDMEAVAKILVKLGDLGTAPDPALSGIMEVDINPLVISDSVPVCVDAGIIRKIDAE